MWVSSEKIVYNIADLHDLPINNNRDRILGYVRQALMEVGLMPEYNAFAEKILLDPGCTSVPKPKDYFSLCNLYLCQPDGTMIQPGYSGMKSKLAFGEDCCRFFDPKYRACAPVLMGEDHHEFFAISGDMDQYESAIIVYLGYMRNDKGELLVPAKAEIAVQSYADYMITSRERNRNRSNIPQSEVDMKRGVWLQNLGSAYGEMKITNRAKMYQLVKKRWYQNMPAPELYRNAAI